MMNQHQGIDILRHADTAIQPITYAIAGLTIFGLNIADWVLLIGLLTGIFNLFFIAVRFNAEIVNQVIPWIRSKLKKKAPDD